MIDWLEDCKDAMWSMFMLNPHPDPETVEIDKETIRDNVARLVRVYTQKGGGYGKGKLSANYIDSRDLPLMQVSILIAATRLALGGYFGEMPEKIEAKVFHE